MWMNPEQYMVHACIVTIPLQRACLMHCKKMGVLLHTSRYVTGIVSYYTPPHSMRFFILIEITVVTKGCCIIL